MATCLYSTNVYLKLIIQERFYGDLHYAWCSENFDCTTIGRYTHRSMVAPSSNPADIFKDLQQAVRRLDQHNGKILEQKTSIKSLAIKHNGEGTISDKDKDEIIYLVDNSPFENWRPLLYIIPYAPIVGRLEEVPIHLRASLGMEYIIKDLTRNEFDIIEF
ncbi:MAG: hypothetical protein NTY36_15700 [Deltaproteobacteria bacterium]|nr:hypothetical protein [Deltaproteobacteria bacterium]